MLTPQAAEDFRDIDCSNPNAVLVGYAPEQLSAQSLSQALHILQDSGGPLIAANKSTVATTAHHSARSDDST